MRKIGLITGIVALAVAGSIASAADVPMEWTMEQARKCWKPMTRAVQHVGVPGHQFQTGVIWDGSLLFGPLSFLDLKVMQKEVAPLGANALVMSVAYGDPMRFVDRTGTGNPLITRSLEGGRLPLPHVETKDGDLVWHEKVFAHLLGRTMAESVKPKKGDMLVTHASFAVRNTGYARRTGHLWLHFGDTSQFEIGYKCHHNADIEKPVTAGYEAPYGFMNDGKIRYVLPKPAKGALKWHDEVPGAVGVKGTPRNVIEWRVDLAPGEEAGLKLAVPYGVVDQAKAAEIATIDDKKQYADVEDFWKSKLYGPGQITTPDPFVNDYLVAVAGQMAQQVACRAESTGVWMYKTSPNHYEGYWPTNAAKALPAFDFRGLVDLNRHVLDGFIQVQTDDVGGLNRAAMGHGDVLKGEGFAKVPGFMGNFGEWTANPMMASHGLGLWALAAHYRITRDDRWLGSGPGSRLQAIIDGMDWIAKQRARTKREENGKKVAHWGLLPAASAHDWLAGNAVVNDGFVIYGMIETVRMLREIKHPRAEEMARELEDYRACLRDRLREGRDQARPLPLPDGSTIPYVPRVIGELDWAKPDWTYTGYGPTRCGAYGALDPNDELVSQTIAYLEAGMPKGEGWYYDWNVYLDTANVNLADVSDPKADRHWMWRHYVEYETMWPIGGPLFLARDDLPRFFEFLFNNLAFVLHQEWRVGVESWDGVVSNAPGDGERWLIVRNMFINERGGYDGSEQELFFLQAIPRSWLRPGSRMSVSNMGTSFGGRADVSVAVAADGGSVVADVELAGLAVTPKDVRMRLRSGDGRPLVSAEVNGKKAEVMAGDIVRLPAARSGSFRVVGRFRAGASGRIGPK